MKKHLSFLLSIIAVTTVGLAPQATVSCKRDILPDGGAIEVNGLPGGASIKSGGGKTVVSVPFG